jgi:hypothetical protein
VIWPLRLNHKLRLFRPHPVSPYQSGCPRLLQCIVFCGVGTSPAGSNVSSRLSAPNVRHEACIGCTKWHQMSGTRPVLSAPNVRQLAQMSGTSPAGSNVLSCLSAPTSNFDPRLVQTIFSRHTLWCGHESGRLNVLSCSVLCSVITGVPTTYQCSILLCVVHLPSVIASAFTVLCSGIVSILTRMSDPRHYKKHKHGFAKQLSNRCAYYIFLPEFFPELRTNWIASFLQFL